MPLSTIPERVTTLLIAIDRADIERLPPAERQRLADQCERVHRLVAVKSIMDDARQVAAPEAGVLARLKDGERSQ